MKSLFVFACLLVSAARGAVLNVYTYDSFDGKDTLGEWMAARAKAATGCDVKYKVFPTAGEALNQVAVEGKKTQADIVIGVDQTLLRRAREIRVFDRAPESLLKPIAPDLIFDSEKKWVPFDYGYLSICYDDRRKNPPPVGMSLQAFAERPEHHKRVVLEDPRTSSLGQSLLVWTRILYPGDAFTAFWKKLLSQAVTVSPGWSAAYGLFLSGEADFVFSYTTSPAYHIEKEKNAHIHAMIFPEGNYRQVEAVGVVSSSTQKECARKWIELLVSAEAQAALPTRQWMYPARAATPLPKSFQALPAVKKVLDSADVARHVGREDLKTWTQLAAGLR